ncbi:hypothetical protein AN403_3676 [Pseudomonas fluorescens]|uniref:Uncharacterized protein n=1 Tax=Pseudomonas fluorescens TaxID=294 RepID=A0A0P8ZRD4_PSEFL|nr:hypothetical protein AN403_3676 [Pseudomonas fluorescens]
MESKATRLSRKFAFSLTSIASRARSYRGRKSGSAARFEVTTMSLRRSTLQIHLNSKKPYQNTMGSSRNAEISDPYK